MLVQVTNGVRYGVEFNGTYEMVSGWSGVVADKRVNRIREGKLGIVHDGTKIQIWVDQCDVQYVEGEMEPGSAVINKAPVMTDDEILAKITKRFNTMDLLGNGMVAGNIRSLMISGAPGIGKTYSLEKKLTAAADAGNINFDMIKGKVSPIGLYIKLFENRHPGSVVVLDDVDVFSNEDLLNVLKAALDTCEKRVITWGTASSFLEERDIPNQFEYEGSIVFITNNNIDKDLERNSKNAPHLDALISRSVYLDLAVHSNRDIMIWVENVINTTTMLTDLGISNSQQADIIHWMKTNVDDLRKVSIRTALQLATFILTEPDQWHDIAEVTMLKPNR